MNEHTHNWQLPEHPAGDVTCPSCEIAIPFSTYANDVGRGLTQIGRALLLERLYPGMIDMAELDERLCYLEGMDNKCRALSALRAE